MKRRSFVKGMGLGAATIAAAPVVASATGIKTNEMDKFEHDPRDYAFVPEEPEEFQEYEVDVPEDWVEESILWV